MKKLRGKKKPLSLAALRSLREEHARTIVPAQTLAREAHGLEHQISDLVNAAYGLTPEEVSTHVGNRPAANADMLAFVRPITKTNRLMRRCLCGQPVNGYGKAYMPQSRHDDYLNCCAITCTHRDFR